MRIFFSSGNTVIIKPSEISMHTAEALHNVFSKYFDPVGFNFFKTFIKKIGFFRLLEEGA